MLVNTSVRQQWPRTLAANGHEAYLSPIGRPLVNTSDKSMELVRFAAARSEHPPTDATTATT